ncbi:MAG TPA: Hsp20/alpha crystallin family protein [Verrucomicrobiae bacterium]|jgi:HSP20 family molecular chaperone IbpA|nr:Hsp20/alpha crystallin family protein [Verrucomicrobiae bacterium]
MENSNINQPGGKTCGVGIFGSLILLVIGVLIGWAGTYYWHSSARGATRSASAATGGEALAVLPAAITIGAPQFSQWDPVHQMSQMQAQIDQIFQRSFAQFRTNTVTGALPANPGYSLSMDVRDMKDKYQVRAFLPDTKASDVKVNLKGDELKVDVANKTTEKATAKNGETAMSEWGNYEEVVPLSGPLKSDKMKIERMPHELIISVPKA